MPRSSPSLRPLALSLSLSGCFNPNPAPLDTTADGSGGETDGTSTTAPIDPTLDPDDTGVTTGNSACGNGVIDEGEDCDDMGESAACNADCTAAACGDGVVNAAAGEECDDGNADDADGCVQGCVSAACGDGYVQAMVEECDDGNGEDGDDCTNACTQAACGDGVVWSLGSGAEACDDMGESATCNADCTVAACSDGVVNAAAGEECDDGNGDDTDACVQGCVSASCGDGFVQAMVEECDDGNLTPGDGCDGLCVNELLPNVLLCGGASRDVTTFFPPMSNLSLVPGCTPDGDTQAMLISRSGVGMYNAAALAAYVSGGGIVLTEYSGTDDVFSALFGNVMEGQVNGSCYDRAPTVVQYSPGDPFWSDNVFNPIIPSDTGCGRDVSMFPGITPLAGWTNTAVAIAYRDLGAGRLWLTDFDWQDLDIPALDASYADTNSLMGYMITHGQ